MNTVDSNGNHSDVYDLVGAITSRSTTIANYLPLCKQLWQDPRERFWLIAALCRKIICITGEPDEAIAPFLAEKVAEDFAKIGVTQCPGCKELTEFLPEIIQLLPAQVWQEPWALWDSLLQAVADEYGFILPENIPSIGETADNRTRNLTVLFTNAVGSKWNDVLESQLSEWRDSADYDWLAALKQSARLDTLLDSITSNSKIPDVLLDPDLPMRLQQMKRFERRRIIRLHDNFNNKDISADPVINEPATMIEWQFGVTVSEFADLQLLVDQKAIGGLQLVRQTNGVLTIENASGVCIPWKKDQVEPLIPRRAAAIETPRFLPLTDTLAGLLAATTKGVNIYLQWQIAKEQER